MSNNLQFPSFSLAVFNNHINDAGKRAMKACRLAFAEFDPDGLAALEKANQDGIMAIFQEKPTEVSRFYANACFIFANGLDKISPEEAT